MTDHDEKQEEQDIETISSKIHPLNVLNVGAYIANVVIVTSIGNGAGDLPSNVEQSAKFQTIVTPAGWAFSIWGLIFAFQALFTVVQLLPRFRRCPMVLEGVSYWYIFVCLFQIGWTLSFAFDMIWASLVFMILIWTALVRLVTSQYYTRDEENKLMQFWLLKFPFELHCGWITAAMAVNVNLVIVSEKSPASVQLTVAIVSLAILHAVAVFVLFGPEKPNYTIPAVLSWANGAIAAELNGPVPLIEETFSEEVVTAVKNAAAAVSIVILILIAVRLIVTIVTATKKHRSTDNRTEDSKVAARTQDEDIV